MEWTVRSAGLHAWENILHLKKPGIYILPFQHASATVLLHSNSTIQLANTINELVWRHDMGRHYDWFVEHYDEQYAFAIITVQEPGVFSWLAHGFRATVCARPVPDQPDILQTVTGPDNITLREDFNRDIVW